VSGILGLWNLDGRPVDAGLLETLNARLRHRGPDGEGYWIQGPVGLAAQMFRVTPESLDETQPLIDPSGVAVVFDGRLDNRDELLGALTDLQAGCPDAALVVTAYRRFGESFPEKLNGDFALALYDAGESRLVLARDSIGVRPLYYTRAGDTFLFASEIKALLAHPQVATRPNDETLADWVLRFPGEDNRGTTFFEGIYSLPPAHEAVLTARHFAVRRYWDFDTTCQVRLQSLPDYVEAFQHHFDNAVRRRLRCRGPAAVSVSGGLDSSSIFCWAETRRRASPAALPSLLGFTHHFPKGSAADEEGFVAEIERQYDLGIERVPVALVGPQRGVRDEVWSVECPVLNLLWHSDSLYLDTIRRRGASVVLTGHWGDHFLGNRSYMVDYVIRGEWGRLWRFARQHPRRFRRNFPRLLFRHLTPEGWLRPVRWVRAKLVRPAWDIRCYSDSFVRLIRQRELAWKPFAGPFASAHAASLYLEVRGRYHVAALEWSSKVAARHGVEAAFPFLDRDLIGFLMAIPGEATNWDEVGKGLLRHAMRDILPPAIAARSGKARLGEFLNPALREEYPRLLQNMESGRMIVTCGYIDTGGLRQALPALRDRMQGQKAEAAFRVRDLLGLETWLELFFQDPKRSQHE